MNLPFSISFAIAPAALTLALAFSDFEYVLAKAAATDKTATAIATATGTGTGTGTTTSKNANISTTTLIPQCRLTDSFAILIQLALGFIALSSLFYKRTRESPRRPIRVWFGDVSKQACGGIIVHILNLLFSLLPSAIGYSSENVDDSEDTALDARGVRSMYGLYGRGISNADDKNRHSVSGVPSDNGDGPNNNINGSSTLDRLVALAESTGGSAEPTTKRHTTTSDAGGEVGQDPCIHYFLNVLLDTTVGVYILWLWLRAASYILSRCITNRRLQRNLVSGYYGDPPRFYPWFLQTVVFATCLFLMKLCVLFTILAIPLLLSLGILIFSPLSAYPHVKVTIVMLIFPLIMSIIQMWLIDTIIARRNVRTDSEMLLPSNNEEVTSATTITDNDDNNNNFNFNTKISTNSSENNRNNNRGISISSLVGSIASRDVRELRGEHHLLVSDADEEFDRGEAFSTSNSHKTYYSEENGGPVQRTASPLSGRGSIEDSTAALADITRKK